MLNNEARGSESPYLRRARKLTNQLRQQQTSELMLDDLAFLHGYFDEQQARNLLPVGTHQDLLKQLRGHYPTARERTRNGVTKVVRTVRLGYAAIIAATAITGGVCIKGMIDGDREVATHPVTVEANNLTLAAADLTAARELLVFNPPRIDIRCNGDPLICLPYAHAGSYPNPAYARMRIGAAMARIGDLGTVDDSLHTVQESLPILSSHGFTQRTFALQRNDLAQVESVLEDEAARVRGGLPNEVRFKSLWYAGNLVGSALVGLGLTLNLRSHRRRIQRNFYQLLDNTRPLAE